MNQQCGQTWLAGFAEINEYYSASNQLPFVQLPTWNDYEEGTELESGIDNCVTISAALSGSTLGWTITGQESTIDYYTVFASQDGVNLMPVEQVAAGTHAADLSALGLPAGLYSFFVKVVAKPGLLNQMSGAVSYTLATPAVMLAVTPTSGIAPVTVTASTAGSTCSGGTIASTQIDFGDGTVVAAASASHAYNSAGMYTVTAIATGSNGLTGTAQQTVTVAANKPPVVALSVSLPSGTAPLSMTASTAGSTAPNGSIASTSIDFGDGTVVSAASATHVYSTAGNFTVKATVTDNVGAKGTAQTSVNITASAPPPPASVQSSGVAVTAPVNNSSVSNPVKSVRHGERRQACQNHSDEDIHWFRIEVLGECRQHQHDVDAEQRLAPYYRAGVGFDGYNLQKLLHHHGEMSLRRMPWHSPETSR